MVLQKSLLDDGHRFVTSFDIESEKKWREEFLSRVLGVIKWYRIEYKDIANSDDKRQPKEHLKTPNYYENDDEGYEDDFYDTDLKASEDEINDFLDFKFSYFRNNKDKIDNIELIEKYNNSKEHETKVKEISKSWLHWKNKIKSNGWGIESFMFAAEEKCTKKQNQALHLLLDKQLSPNSIAKELGKSRQTIQSLLSDAFLRVGLRP